MYTIYIVCNCIRLFTVIPPPTTTASTIYVFSSPVSSKKYCRQSFQNWIVYLQIESIGTEESAQYFIRKDLKFRDPLRGLESGRSFNDIPMDLEKSKNLIFIALA